MLIAYFNCSINCLCHRSNCRLRVFALADKSGDLNNDQRNMASLLNKFRIDYSDVIVISDDSKPPKKENKIKFKKLIENWRVRDIPSETVQTNYHESTTSNPTPTSSSSPPPSPDLPSSSSPSPTSNSSLFITDSEWESQKNKSYRQIRIRELIEKHSSKSSLIVMLVNYIFNYFLHHFNQQIIFSLYQDASHSS